MMSDRIFKYGEDDKSQWVLIENRTGVVQVEGWSDRPHINIAVQGAVIEESGKAYWFSMYPDSVDELIVALTYFRDRQNYVR